MQIKLSQRLSAIAGMVPQGSITADIGTDHGYLPAYLVIRGVSPSVIATDVKEQPLAAAANLISLLAIEKKVDLRFGDGLAVLVPGEAQTLVIAGMGASTMIKILEQSPQVLAQAGRLILQSMRGTPSVRIWLTKHGWKIRDEELVYEDSIFYEIIAAEPGNNILAMEEAEVGPILIKKKHPLLKSFIEEKIKVLEKISQALENSKKVNGESRKKEIEGKTDTLKRVMKCL